MVSLRRIGVLIVLTALLGFSASSARADDGRQTHVPLRNRPVQFPEIHPDPTNACRGLSGGTYALCDSFCNIYHCTLRSSVVCDIVRWKFMHLTFGSTFPCEEVAPTPTRTATATPTLPPTATPTLTVPAGTATATITPEESTPTPSPTETSEVEPTETETAEPTATDTEGVEPTATETEAVEPTATETEQEETTPTATITGTPTGTAAATFTASPTATSTPQSTATNTPEPTSTNTSAPPTATNTAQDTPTATPSETPTPTETPQAPECPLAAGNYALTQVAGGFLTVDGLPAFPFPAGGTINQTVGEPDADCVHQTTVAFPGGFSAPTFCIPALGFSTSVVQTGCGIGLIDSDGGSDFTITETGDTSSPGTPCSLAASCSPGANSNVRVDITVGDGSPDTCSFGTANATVSVPVFTTTWLTFSGCPDPDGTFNPPPGGSDTLIVSFPQTLDFTTDTTTAVWDDIDGDGCAIAGSGPAAGFGTVPGTCIDLAGLDTAGTDVTTVASGTIGSSGAPLYDLTFVTVLPNELTTIDGGPATCAEPPIINYGGTATRCIGAASASDQALTTGRSLRLRHRGILGESLSR